MHQRYYNISKFFASPSCFLLAGLSFEIMSGSCVILLCLGGLYSSSASSFLFLLFILGIFKRCFLCVSLSVLEIVSGVACADSC